MHDITVQLPDSVYIRLNQSAKAMGIPFADVLLRAIRTGSPPDWHDIPAEFQANLATLDRLNDESLWQIARSRQSEADMVPYNELLDKNGEGLLSEAEKRELAQLRTEADLFMLRKAHAVALLRWRGHTIPPADKL